MITRGQSAESHALKAAYAVCARWAAAHDENFPVASRLLPRAVRPHVAAVYAFARAADDFADEGTWSADERQRLIDDWLERLHTCAGHSATDARCDWPPAHRFGESGRRSKSDVRRGTPGAPHASRVAGCRRLRQGFGGPTRLDERSVAGPGHSGLDESDQLFLALGDTIRRCQLPVSLFEDLISAFRQDITTHRYETWDDILEYCQRSANPVGRLVLRIAGYRDDRLDRGSDSLCTALQLTNFWQDLELDWRRGRLYVPAEDWRSCGAREVDLDAGRLTDGWRRALARVAGRTRELFEQGREVCDGVRGRLGLELRLTWLGGMRILERVEEAGFDVVGARPRLGATDGPTLLWRALTWRPAAHRPLTTDHES